MIHPPDLYVERCDVGRGVFAARAFEPGEPLLRFDGPDLDDPRDGSALEANLLQVAPNRYILPDPPAVYVNHSCDPNAAFLHGQTLSAVAAIAPGAEVRFDYSTTMLDDPWTLACRCGSALCRGTVRSFDRLDRAVRARYLDRGWVMPFIRLAYGPGAGTARADAGAVRGHDGARHIGDIV